MLSLLAEYFQVAGLADVARVQAPLRVGTVSRHLLPSVQMVALFAVASSVELPVRVGTTRRELNFLSFVRFSNRLFDFTC